MSSRVFVDTSVFFAAVYSSTGFARDLIRAGIRGTVQLVVSQDVLEEATRNLARKAPEKVAVFEQFLMLLQPEIVSSPASEALKAVEAYVAAKDAPIVAAAIEAKVDYLVTYDRQHLLEPVEVAQKSGLTIVIPDVVMEILAKSEE